jgi:pimeloyl-ACP methyl ester carboxylesterase
MDNLPKMTLPFLIYVGENDPFYKGARESVDLIPNGAFVSLPDLGHTPALYRSDIVLPPITSLLQTVSRDS